MRRYFYTAPPLMKNWLENQYNLTKVEDKYFRDALLATIKLSLDQSAPKYTLQPERLHELRQKILDMTMQEQDKYSNNIHLEMVFKSLDSLYRNSRGKNMVIKGGQTNVKDLVDPDKFPVWDLKAVKNIFYSRWSQLQGALRYDNGHQLIVGDSLVQHPSGGRGVFIVLKKGKQRIYPGDFLGYVPGVIYETYNSYRSLKLNQLQPYQKISQHIHFPSGKVLELSQLCHTNNKIQMISQQQYTKAPKISPQMVNPYALGHMVNHPPVDKEANVIFTQIQLSYNFLPSHLRNKYLPYNSLLPKQVKKINNKNKKITIFGIIAAKQIQSYQQLYVDYCENHIYPIEDIPEWMVEPIPNSYVNFSKGQYQNPTKSYWEWIQKQALKQKQDLYEKYKSTIRRSPGKIIHQDEKTVIREMNIQNNLN